MPESDNYQGRIENNTPINLTPENTYNNFNLLIFEKPNKELLPPPKRIIKEETPKEDPDVTQLEIDISSASLSATCSQNSNFKKRQLILSNEALDGQSLISEIISYSPHNEI